MITMTTDYKVVPVDAAKALSVQYDKPIVIICCWDRVYNRLHTTTYGASPADKISAAKGGEICAQSLGMDLDKSESYEDFRTVNAARNASDRERLRDVCKASLHGMASYENGNSSPDLARELADRLRIVLQDTGGI